MFYNHLQLAVVAKIKIVSTIISSAVAIALAYHSVGVWALIVQQELMYFTQTVLFWTMNLKNNFKLFQTILNPQNFSPRLLTCHWLWGRGLSFSSLVNITYDNIYLQLSGKHFPLAITGYFSQAKRLNDIPGDFFNQNFNAALFPLFSKIEDSKEF